MKRTRHTPEQVIRKLREADRMLAEGKGVAEIANGPDARARRRPRRRRCAPRAETA